MAKHQKRCVARELSCGEGARGTTCRRNRNDPAAKRGGTSPTVCPKGRPFVFPLGLLDDISLLWRNFPSPPCSPQPGRGRALPQGRRPRHPSNTPASLPYPAQTRHEPILNSGRYGCCPEHADRFDNRIWEHMLAASVFRYGSDRSRATGSNRRYFHSSCQAEKSSRNAKDIAVFARVRPTPAPQTPGPSPKNIPWRSTIGPGFASAPRTVAAAGDATPWGKSRAASNRLQSLAAPRHRVNALAPRPGPGFDDVWTGPGRDGRRDRPGNRHCREHRCAVGPDPATGQAGPASHGPAGDANQVEMLHIVNEYLKSCSRSVQKSAV